MQRSMDANVQWTARRGRLSAVTLLVLVAAGGCNDLPAPAVRQIKRADQAYRLSRYLESDRLAGEVIRAHSRKPDTAEAYYLRGLSRLKQARRADAEADFRAALRLCRRRALEVLLCVQMGNLAFQDGAYARSAGFYRRGADDLPANVPIGQVWYRYGLSLQRSGEFDRARAVFRRLVNGRPAGAMGSNALRQMAWKHDYFTVQCGAFSRMESARAAAANLLGQGIEAVASRQDRRGAPPYVVYAGRYRNYAFASAALPAIRRIQGDAFIVP